MHYCEIYYLSAANYDPETTALIFFRANIYPGAGEGGLQLISKAIYFIMVTVYLAALPYNICRGHYLPRGTGRGGLQTYLKLFTLLVLLPCFYLYQENKNASSQIFHNKQILSYRF